MIKVLNTDERTVAEVVANMGGNVKGEASKFGVLLRDDEDLAGQDYAEQHEEWRQRADDAAQYWRAGQ